MTGLSKKDYALRTQAFSTLLEELPNLNHIVTDLPLHTFLISYNLIDKLSLFFPLKKIVKFHNIDSPALSLKITVQHKYRTIKNVGAQSFIKIIEDELLSTSSATHLSRKIHFDQKIAPSLDSDFQVGQSANGFATELQSILDAYKDGKLTVHMSNFHRGYEYKQFSMKCEDGKNISSHYAKTKTNIVFISDFFGRPRNDFKMSEFLNDFKIWHTKDLYDFYFKVFQ